MNIFVLDQDPVLAAQMQCDKHVIKMTLETVQLLSTAITELGGTGPYKPTHKNHPCAIWARQSYKNWCWLFQHGRALAAEYQYRYGKEHACAKLLTKTELRFPDVPKPNTLYTPPQCMPDHCKVNPNRNVWFDAVDAYRRYYVFEKLQFARWTRRPRPDWWDQILRTRLDQVHR